MSAASEEIREFLQRLSAANPGTEVRGTFLDKIDALLRERDELFKASEAAASWAHDPNDPDQWERIAEEFRRATNFLRPGKDVSPAAGPYDYVAAERAWETWRKERSASVLAGLRAALKTARGE